jgi:hypothetical protein
MARAFRPVGGAYVAELDEAEAKLVAQLALDVKEMLDTRAELTGDLVPEATHDDAPAGPGASPRRGAGERATHDDAPAGPGAAPHQGSGEQAAGTDADAGTRAEDRWWEALGLSPADLGVGPDGELLADNEALPLQETDAHGGAADLPGAAGGAAAPRPTTRRRARPSDPALARLLPDLVAGGDAAVGEAERLRALTEPGLVAAKRANLAEAAQLLSLDPLRVPAADAPRFASALNDIRLVLAERLGIESAEDAARVAAAEEDPEDELGHYLALLYGFVSWLQESLMTALLRRKH